MPATSKMNWRQNGTAYHLHPCAGRLRGTICEAWHGFSAQSGGGAPD